MEKQLPSSLVKSLGLNGHISDFNSDWFVQTGDSIVLTLKVNIVFPVLIEFGQFVIRFMTRKRD
jgi:hypothetical protein